jgi:hypothetical protein
MAKNSLPGMLLCLVKVMVAECDNDDHDQDDGDDTENGLRMTSCSLMTTRPLNTPVSRIRLDRLRLLLLLQKAVVIEMLPYVMDG